LVSSVGSFMDEFKYTQKDHPSSSGEMPGCSIILPTQTIAHFEDQIINFLNEIEILEDGGTLIIFGDVMNYTLASPNYQQLGNLLYRNPNGFGCGVSDEPYRQNRQDMATLVFNALTLRAVSITSVNSVQLKGFDRTDLASNDHNDSEFAKKNPQWVDHPPFSLLVLAICQFMNKHPEAEILDYQLMLSEFSEIQTAQPRSNASVWLKFQLCFKQ